MESKVFISYSWSNLKHQGLIKEWADRLLADGIDVILDIYDLKEGHDKYVFMEKMVTDSSITHVLIMCDQQYTEKANIRKDGVGTESQIISQEVYNKVDQSKFIPIVCEFDSDGNPYLPTFINSRIWIDFSTFEAVNENWERLVRLLFGKPEHIKPKRGKAPAYITTDEATSTSHILAKFQTFKQALLQNKKGIRIYRWEFLDECLSYVDDLRVRKEPESENFAEKVLQDLKKLKPVRDYIIDWILLENESISENFSDELIEFLEKFKELKRRPEELNPYNKIWFSAHKIFVYETFIYVVAALMKTKSFESLHEIFAGQYFSSSDSSYGTSFERFDLFYDSSEILNDLLSTDGRKYHSANAEFIRRNANRKDLTFEHLKEADLLMFLIHYTSNIYWYPNTLYHSSYHDTYPFFIKASRHKNFINLATITGIDDVNTLREKINENYESLRSYSGGYLGRTLSFKQAINFENLDTLP